MAQAVGRIKAIAGYILLGAAAFWIPDIIIDASKRSQLMDALGPLVQTALLPAILVMAYFRVRRRARIALATTPIALWMLLGVWLLGSIGMAVGQSFTGGTFFKTQESVAFLLALGVLPPVTFMIATYDGSLFALLLATIVMPIVYVRYESHCWQLPPSIIRRLPFRRA